MFEKSANAKQMERLLNPSKNPGERERESRTTEKMMEQLPGVNEVPIGRGQGSHSNSKPASSRGEILIADADLLLREEQRQLEEDFVKRLDSIQLQNASSTANSVAQQLHPTGVSQSQQNNFPARSSENKANVKNKPSQISEAEKIGKKTLNI